MTELTEESLIEVLERLADKIKAVEDCIALRPQHLIMPPAIYRRLMYRPPIRKAKGIRGRKKAICRRPAPVMWKLMKGSI